MGYIFRVVFLCFLFVSFSLFSQNVAKLKKDRSILLENIALTNKLLSETNQTTISKYNQLNILAKQLEMQQKVISSYNKEISYITNNIASVGDSITLLNKDIAQIREDYAKIIYYSWRNRNGLDQLMYVLAGIDINQSYRRLRYMSEYNAFRKNQVVKLQAKEQLLASKKIDLQVLKKDKSILFNSERALYAKLNTEKSTYSKQLSVLSSKESNLKKSLNEYKAKAAKLDKEIAKIIEKEVSKTRGQDGKMALTPSEKLTASNFLGNKGNLPWPVERGVIINHFGRQKNTVLKNEFTVKSGIDIQTEKNGVVRSIFEGVVAGVYAIKGSNQTLIVKHGNFLSLYANLSDVYVKKGDVVKTKQALGICFYDEKQNNTLLHFQIWKETNKQNPEEWISH